MPYRKVGYKEQCWYILREWMRQKLHPRKEKRCRRNQNEAVPTQDAQDLPTGNTARSTRR